MSVDAMIEPAGAPGLRRDTRVLVSAEDELLQHRAAAALRSERLQPELQVRTPDDLSAEEDSAAIVVFACDVERAERVTALRRLRRRLSAVRIVVISPPTTGTGVRRALEAGCDALVLEPEIEATLAITVLALAAGQSAVPRKLRAGVERPAFSHREKQVLRLVPQGLTNAEIAESLFLSESTIKSHLASAFAKLGVRSRKEVAALFVDPEAAMSVGLVAPGGAPAPNGSLLQDPS